MCDPPSWLGHLSKVPSPDTLTFGVRISVYVFWKDTNTQSIAWVSAVNTEVGKTVLLLSDLLFCLLSQCIYYGICSFCDMYTYEYFRFTFMFAAV